MQENIRVSGLRNRHLTGPKLAAFLSGSSKTSISMSTVKKSLQDTDLLGRLAKKKPDIRLANERKILRHQTE